MHDAHRQLIDRFYTAFGQRDADGMVACYHDQIQFSDPVFPDLKGPQAGAMWRMLCERGTDLQIEHQIHDATEASGHATWTAHYTFSATGRKVVNVIDARMRFRDGLIVEHRDTFGLWRWTRMALGAKGILLGWLPPVQNAVRAQAAAGLAKFTARGE